MLIALDGTIIHLTVKTFVPYLTESEGQGLFSMMAGGAQEFNNTECSEWIVEAMPSGQVVDESSTLIEAEEPITPGKSEQLKAEATSLLHLMSHTPKNPFCETCRLAKAQFMQRRKVPVREELNQSFGTNVTGDNIRLTKAENAAINGDEAGILLVDLGTDFWGFKGQPTKSAVDNGEFMRFFAGRETVESFYSDSAPDLNAAAADLGWLHPTSTPHEPKNNSMVEVRMKIIENGAKCSLLQAGLDANWWQLACAFWAIVHNITKDSTAALRTRIGKHRGNDDMDRYFMEHGYRLERLYTIFRPERWQHHDEHSVQPRLLESFWDTNYNLVASLPTNIW